ncbi:two-component system, OmpR family, heavy metal sensor histidine kinase CusS [Novimethylophilus kurashikiensis]|uniref:Sensor protein n=1 Tax=Novimethylophilus kurashikiensis TaxID=1825523 RepID=A0A2R5FE37_9PROT|nr:heavy metal sensor histidine kinase [Novimethylophilus kurashikiensis]GBG14764.1 two-component system, OmpR family, heavy metal sensor histidine kinase CusS [Novimethylophilus kurashikiensis]
MKRTQSITFRLTLFFSTASTAVLLVMGALVGSFVQAHFEEMDRAELDGKLQLVRHALTQVNSFAEMKSLPQHLADALVGHPDLSVTVMTSDHQGIFTTTDATFAEHLLRNIASETPVEGHSRLMVWSTGHEIYRGITAGAKTSIPDQPPMVVALAINIEHHQEFMTAFQHNLWLAIAAGIGLTVLLGWVAARRGLEPVRQMAKVTRGVSASHLGDRIPPGSVPRELTDLAKDFNDMLARLEDSFKRLSDFSSDLAHELRTPISNLMTQTQVAISKERSIDEYREVLYSNLEEYERLARMIADMLFLAKADNGLIVPSTESVNLALEVRELFAFYEAVAEEKDIKLVLNGAGIVKGNKLMLRRALSNLLSNAIRHSAKHTEVKIAIEQSTNGEATLIIENEGEVIPPEHLPRLFDRFYRVDPSRQKTSDGAGLGLAITKSIIEAHQGKIRVWSEKGLTRFELSLSGKYGD